MSLPETPPPHSCLIVIVLGPGASIRDRALGIIAYEGASVIAEVDVGPFSVVGRHAAAVTDIAALPHVDLRGGGRRCLAAATGWINLDPSYGFCDPST